MTSAGRTQHRTGAHRVRSLAVVGFVAVSALLTGCLHGQTGTGSASSGPQPGEASHITVLSQLGDMSALQPVLNRLNAQYMKLHPKTKVTVQYETFDELNKTVPTTLASGSGPDVLDYDANESTLGSLAHRGLVIPLDSYAAKYGWKSKLTPATVSRLSYTGHLDGVGRSSEGVGLFYNADLFAKYGIAPPTTFAAVESAAKQLKARGLTPCAFGNKDQWPSSHFIGAFIHSMVPVNKIQSIETVAGHGRWTDPAVVKAISTAAGFAKSGYVTPDFNGVSYEQAKGAFYAGKAGMFIADTSITPDLQANMRHTKVKFVPFPMHDPNAKQQMEGGLGGAWAITRSSKAPAVAADWINFVHFSPQAQRAWLAAGVLPTTTVKTKPGNVSPLVNETLTATQAVQANGGMGYWSGYSSSSLVSDAWASGAQLALTGKESPQAFAENLQAALDQARSSAKETP